ncbi:hypothetical protein PILCRDRAFT_15421 [Piloderma croceum F 1598]|uniref:Uncharacterized protein n=1 Tax=Piloderma croceum (strain F 1598) TaxID=765440 RepID=A0A0C3B7E4_PILCF|nr:hypothetical protein PILCRDRAFT_15421 [Piloderma croceum F 1598]
MRSCENESDSDIAVYTHDADKWNIATHCASSLTSYFYLSLLNNAIQYSAPLAAALYGLPHCSPDRYCDTSTPIVGSSGSTPLQFAAANGHTGLLLKMVKK